MIGARRLAGLGSGAAIVAAGFAPAVTIGLAGTLSLYTISPTITAMLALSGALSAFYAWNRAAKGQLVCGVAGIVLGALGLYRTLIEIGLRASQLEEQMRDLAKAANFPDQNPPMASMMMGTRLEWGWYLLAIGLVACLVSALAGIRRTDRQDPPSG